MSKDPIKRVRLQDGRTRWRFVIDIGPKPDGRRDQRTFTYDTKKEAIAERAKVLADKARGSYIRPDDALTLEQAAKQWLAGKRKIRPGTRRTYADALARATSPLGAVPIQKLTKAQLDHLVTVLLASGRRVSNRHSKALSPRSVNLTLMLVTAVLDDQMRQGNLARNVAKLVDRVEDPKDEMVTWTAQQAAAFLASVAGHRLYAAWNLSLYGLRRSEVLGLRWSDVDLVGRTLTIRNCRTAIGGSVVEGPPKTRRSKRTLPLDDGLVAALDALALAQRDEHDRAFGAYRATCALCGGVHLVADELGHPYLPQTYSDLFERLARAAKLPAIRLHDTRHTCGTLMHLRGVPAAVISAWLGHSSAAFTMATYVHSQDEALTNAGQTLRDALNGETPVR